MKEPERQCWNLEVLSLLYCCNNGMRHAKKFSSAKEINRPDAHKAVSSLEFDPPLKLTRSLQTDKRVE